LVTKDSLFSLKKILAHTQKAPSCSSPLVMGILNTTPDSFYADSRVQHIDRVIAKATQMQDEGADILDIGGYSSRPGADDISIKEECSRVLPVIEALKQAFPNSLLSIDTFRSEVAEKAVKKGVEIINDISGGTLDPNMHPFVCAAQMPYICMHMKGDPQTMVEKAKYDNILEEISTFFASCLEGSLSQNAERVILDPGFGFAKNIDQNFYLLRYFGHFQKFNMPILAGVSRKSMIWKSLKTSPEKALNGTTVCNVLALQGGASILRVHDVKEAVETIKLTTRTWTAST
jgi:dihydropteroate synthase